MDALDDDPFGDEGRWPPELDAGSTLRSRSRAIVATPYVWRDPKTIPPREFLYGRHIARRYLSATVAPGGVGKSSLALVEAVAMATGHPLLGVQPAGRFRVWYWCGEDPLDEIERRVAAILIHYRINPAELDGRLFIGSGRGTEIIIAAMAGKDGAKVSTPVVDQMTATIVGNGIDLVVIDPFVSSHRVPENDNGAIDMVAKAWNGLAEKTNCAIELVHHVRKGQSGQGEFTVEDGRGAVALVSAARSARVLNRMSEDEGKQAGVENRFSYFRATNGKANLAPMAEHSDWHHLASVPLENGAGGLIDKGDWVGVVTAWTWPDMMASVSVSDLRAVQAKVAAGRYRENHQARDWIGAVIADVLRLDPKADRKRILAILKAWTANGMFVVVGGKDDKGNERRFVEVGQLASD